LCPSGPIKDEHDQAVLDSAGNLMEGLLHDKYSGRKGRIDVLVVVEADGETLMVIIELKSTDWSRMRPERHCCVERSRLINPANLPPALRL
jgi:hypothetical protein